MPATPSWRSRAKPCRPQPIAQFNRSCSNASSIRLWRVRRCARREADMLGKLSWDAIPFNEPLPLLSGAVVGIVILAILVTVTVKGLWPFLWREWLLGVDTMPICLLVIHL